jgi:hypothetical protein
MSRTNEFGKFFAEVRRRNVYKIAVAYIVAGWALSQGVAHVFPVFDVPNWVVRLIVLLIIVGLPVALALTWMFEPRSNTTRRAVFQQQLPEALKIADGVFISQVARLEQIPEDQRLKPDQVVAAIAEAGRPAFYEQNANAIVDRIVPLLQPRDVVVVFSNGGFDNIHDKLLARLRA